jgi:hypothetical protein
LKGKGENMSEQFESTGKELTIISQRELTPQVWAMINSMSPVLHKSRMFGVTSPEAAAAIMLKGYELGLSITASFELINVIQGKPSLSPRGAMALLLNSPKIKQIKVTPITDKNGKYLGHECYMQRDNGFEYTAQFTLEDAEKAGLVKPGSGWANYPLNMCQWRAIGFCADVVAPDLTSGLTAIMKAPEMMGVALTETGEVIDAAATPVPAPTPTQSEPAQVITLEYLANTYGGEAILVANQGQLPGTQEELDAIYQKLAVPA